MGPFAFFPSQNLPCFDLSNKQAHPKYGSILASSSYDGKVLIWRESPNSQWTIVANFALHNASVNIVSWSPHESGCLLACASSDGQVSILEFQEGNWTHQIFPAHGQGVNAVSWAPATQPGSLVSSKPGVEGKGAGGGVRRFVTGGSDGVVKIWDYKYALLLTPLSSNLPAQDVAILMKAPAAHKIKPTLPSKNLPATPTGSATWPGPPPCSKNPT